MYGRDQQTVSDKWPLVRSFVSVGLAISGGALAMAAVSLVATGKLTVGAVIPLGCSVACFAALWFLHYPKARRHWWGE